MRTMSFMLLLKSLRRRSTRRLKKSPHRSSYRVSVQPRWWRDQDQRPITLHMKYHPECEGPLCHLVSDADPTLAEEKSLMEIQAYIEAENERLECESCQFSAKEIMIKVEYKHCPNLTIIDTPGLIAPAPGQKNRALQAQACAVESLVRAKMQHKEFIILCLEDCSDWSNATTRSMVMQIDTELSRTVIVSTKLDTRIPQFARPSDVEVFLFPPACALDGYILGDSPFFTSVPSGRVGSGSDSVYSSNDEFKQAVCLREMEDVASLEKKLGRSLSKQERSRIGVSKLGLFLEEMLQKSTTDEAKLKEKGRAFHDLFLNKDWGTGWMIGIGCESQRLYHITLPPSAVACTSIESLAILHNRLGHFSLSKLCRMILHLSNLFTLECESCRLRKQIRISFPKHVNN